MKTQIFFLATAMTLIGVVIKHYYENIETEGIFLKIIQLWEDKVAHVSMIVSFFILMFLVLSLLLNIVFGEAKEMERIVHLE